MTKTIKNMILGSMVAAGLVALAAIADLATGYPFGGKNMVMNIMFIVSAALVIYMAYDSYQDAA